MSKKVYVIKAGNEGVDNRLTTPLLLGTNDVSMYPKRANGEPCDMDVSFRWEPEYDGRYVYITEDPTEISMITDYLKKTQNPFFYDLDNPDNLHSFYIPEELR